MYNSNNIGGFNITNFKMKFMNDYIADVISDYSQSLIGSFTQSLIYKMQNEDLFKTLDLYFSITKVEGEMGYSLVQGEESHQIDIAESLQESVIMERIAQSRDGQRSKSYGANRKNGKQINARVNLSQEKYLVASQTPRKNDIYTPE